MGYLPMISSHKTIEDCLAIFKPVIGVDLEKYKNHVYRVFLNCLLLDSESTNEEKYAIAAVFHDIGIWTNHTIDYLEPSIEHARTFLNATSKENWEAEISLMIYWHHKPGKYTGDHSHTVEIFRKADWIDVSLGVKTFGLNRQKIKDAGKNFPNKGFHLFLIRKLFRNFLSHPLKPLPMFKTH